MDEIIEMESHDVWMHAKMEEEARLLKIDEALDVVSKIVDGWIRENRG
jgi:hypothetical protein